MSRRLPGSLLLILIFLGLLYTRPAWAGSDSAHSANVSVRLSPLALLLQNNVTIKVGEFTCQLANGSDPSSVCPNLPPGEYKVSAHAEGYFVAPSSYRIDLSSEPNSGSHNDLFFNLYQNNHQLYMPSLQVQP
jgi:hypothetical protein